MPQGGGRCRGVEDGLRSPLATGSHRVLVHPPRPVFRWAGSGVTVRRPPRHTPSCLARRPHTARRFQWIQHTEKPPVCPLHSRPTALPRMRDALLGGLSLGMDPGLWRCWAVTRRRLLSVRSRKIGTRRPRWKAHRRTARDPDPTGRRNRFPSNTPGEPPAQQHKRTIHRRARFGIACHQ